MEIIFSWAIYAKYFVLGKVHPNFKELHVQDGTCKMFNMGKVRTTSSNSSKCKMKTLICDVGYKHVQRKLKIKLYQ